MKNKKIFTFFSVITILLIVFFGIFILNNKTSFNYTLKTMSLTKINTNEFESLIKKKERHFIYVGRKTCPDCLNLISKTNKVIHSAKKYGEVYYYDTDYARDDLGFEKFTDKVGISFVPTIIELEDGEIKRQFSSEEINNYKKINNYIEEETQ